MLFATTPTVSEESLVDLQGKVLIVTGGNTGLGYATVQFLVRKGAKVYLAARDEERANAAIDRLRKEDIRSGTLHWLKLDLSDPRLAKSAAEEFMQRETRLDILVNNAAISPHKASTLNKDGLHDIMVVNHISHFALTETLSPILKATAKESGSDVRIVNLTSISHTRAAPTSFAGKESLNLVVKDTMGGYLDAYGHTKLANILHIKQLQRNFDQDGVPITCIAVHPGAIKTEGSDKFVASVPYLKPLVRFLAATFIFDASWSRGAMTTAFAAASKEVAEGDRAKYKGVYMVPVARIAQPSKWARDERLARELHQTTMDVLRELGVV